MANIAILLPGQNILEYAEKVIAEREMDVRILKVVDNDSAVAQAAAAVETGCRIIIARGFQALMIKQHINVPVVEMTMSTQEMGLMIRKAKQQLKKEHPVIGIIVFQNMLGSTEYLEEIFEFELKVYLLQNLDEVEEKIRQAIRDGVELVIGGRNVMQAAFEIGFPCLFIETREESIRYALDIAEKMAEVADMALYGDRQLETVFDTSFNGIVKINAYREIVAVNRVIENFLGRPAESVIGFPAEEILGGLDVEGISRILDGTEEVYSGSIYMENSLFMVMGAPIRYNGSCVGAILTFHKIRSLDRAGRESVYENVSKGYVARRDFDAILRKSEGIRQCIQLARCYVLSQNPVLIEGETGTEKELFAESIHNHSRSRGPFININCSTLDAVEQKRILFGISPATDGERERQGVCLLGQRGTLFLQEIETLSMECQWLIYKAAHDHMLWKNETMTFQNIPMRLIAATGVSLWEQVKRGTFRKDLCYLLCGQRIYLPPLRENPDDIEEMASLYIRKFESVYSRYIDMSEEARKVMRAYAWGGNLIQLEGFCERLVLTAHKKKVDEGMIRYLLRDMYPAEEKMPAVCREPEAERLEQLLKKYLGNRKKVAEELNVSTTTVWRRMKKYGII